MRRACLSAVVLLSAVLTPLSGAASAASNPVIVDCRNHGMLTRSYSIGQLQHALSTMDAPTKEYTSCPDVINRALGQALANPGGKGGTGGNGSGSFLPTPVLIILVVLLLAAVSFGAVAVRRRNDAGQSG